MNEKIVDRRGFNHVAAYYIEMMYISRAFIKRKSEFHAVFFGDIQAD